MYWDYSARAHGGYAVGARGAELCRTSELSFRAVTSPGKNEKTPVQRAVVAQRFLERSRTAVRPMSPARNDRMFKT